MKKILLLPLLCLAGVAFGQGKLKTKEQPTIGSNKKFDMLPFNDSDRVIFRYNPGDTVFMMHVTDLNRIYTLLQVGQQAINSSDNFSINQRKEYQREISRVDSGFRQQILGWYPVKKKITK